MYRQLSRGSSSSSSLRNNSYNNNDHNILISKVGEEEEAETVTSWHFMRFKHRAQFRFFKILLGFLIIIISLVLLVWNEKRAAEISKSYQEGLGSIRILANALNILPENDGKLVFVNGYLSVFEPLEEYLYGVSIYAVKLKRRAQMYQWTEEKISQPNEFDLVPYRYSKMWRDKLVNSDEFVLPMDHANPKNLAVTSEIRINSNVRLGSFILGPELKVKFTNFIQFTGGERPGNQQIKMHMGLYYHSSDIWNPSVGDLRVQFSFAGPSDTFISVIAMQSGKELKPFFTESGIQILYLYEGRINHLEIFRNEHSASIYRSWNIRACIWITLIIGAFLATKSITHLNRRNSIVKNLMSVGPFKLSLVATSSLSLSTIGLVWMTFKPVFGFLLVTFSGCLILYYSIVPNETETNESLKIVSKSPKKSSSARAQIQNTQLKSKD